MLKRKTEINANYLLYLLSLFEGKISITELCSLPIAFVSSLQSIQEKNVEEQNKAIKEMQRKQQEDGGPSYIDNNGNKYKKPNTL